VFLEILDKIRQLLVSHDKMIVVVRRTSMYKIKIDLLILVGKRKITVSSHSLDKIISLVRQRIFTEDHAADESLGSGGAIDVRIVRLKKVLEVIVMMISKFDEHEHIGVSVRNDVFDPFIIGIVLMNVRE